MKTKILILVCLAVVGGCAQVDDWMFGGARRNRQRVEERHEVDITETQSLIDSRDAMTRYYLDANDVDIDLEHREQIKHNLEVEYQLRSIKTDVKKLSRKEK